MRAWQRAMTHLGLRGQAPARSKIFRVAGVIVMAVLFIGLIVAVVDQRWWTVTLDAVVLVALGSSAWSDQRRRKT